MKTRNPTSLKKAAAMLQDIRSERFDCNADNAALAARVDAIGTWLATDKVAIGEVGRLLRECHELHDILMGGTGNQSNRIVLN